MFKCFWHTKILNSHIDMCQNMEPCKIDFPKQ